MKFPGNFEIYLPVKTNLGGICLDETVVCTFYTTLSLS